MSPEILKILAERHQIPQQRLIKIIDLFEQGGTIPFVARYRKEVTGSLDEVILGDIKKGITELQELVKRKEYILGIISEQNKLPPQLKDKISQTWDSHILEDLYLPFKPKKKTRATKARELGLTPLAKEIMQQRNDRIKSFAERFVKNGVESVDMAISGAQDIIAEWISENEKTRSYVRGAFERGAMITAKVVKSKKEEAEKYRDYFDFSERLGKCPSHRLLAIRRGEDEGLLRVSVQPDIDILIEKLSRFYVQGKGPCSDLVHEALTDSYKRLLGPSIESEFRKSSKEKADAEAIAVFRENLKQLLLSPPLGEKRVLALDPGFRTGCKLICLNEGGDLLYNTAIYPHPPQNQRKEAADTVLRAIKKYRIDAIAIGNGTAGRETQSFIQEIITDNTKIFMVNESGASIYSASEVARQEFPDHDITVRGAVSIGRRLMDPLAELVKIDPKSIGVGQYQHDVNQVQLKEGLKTTIEYCVNSVGINVNTASPNLLTYVSGLGDTLAHNIIEHRQDNGPFSKRKDLLKVPRMGAKAFEQSAGFLRIRDAAHPLDNTAVHPERYALVERMAKDQKVSVHDLIEDRDLRDRIDLKKYLSEDIGMPTLTDIMEELSRPGLDPRGEATTFEFDRNVRTIDDLKVGMVLKGIVTNLTNFGAFVDIGIKGDGLIHISRITDRFIKSPTEILSLGEAVRVKVIDIDTQRKRVSLSMKDI